MTSTDHLDDRGLFTHLWDRHLHDKEEEMPPGTGWCTHIGVLGGGGQEDLYLWLKYYADDDDRAGWAQEWPDQEMPEHEEPPYGRDLHLPEGADG